MKARVVQLMAPGRVELQPVTVGKPGPGQVLVRSEVSALSAGSERLVFDGRLEPELPLDEALPVLGGGLRYPVAYGYCSVGRVEALGEGVHPALEGTRVFAFHPHQSLFLADAAQLIPLPEGLSAEAGALLANTETAVSLVMDGAPILGEVSVVIGLGIVGQLVLAIASRLGLGPVHGVELRADRRAIAAEVSPAAALLAAPEGDLADLVYEVSGVPKGLEAALAVARREGRVIAGSWYGAGAAPLILGTRAHRNRNTIRFSQVSHLDPALTGRFDRVRRMKLALDWLSRLPVEPLITHRVPFSEAPEAWELLRASPRGCLQILLTHEGAR